MWFRCCWRRRIGWCLFQDDLWIDEFVEDVDDEVDCYCQCGEVDGEGLDDGVVVVVDGQQQFVVQVWDGEEDFDQEVVYKYVWQQY